MSNLTDVPALVAQDVSPYGSWELSQLVAHQLVWKPSEAHPDAGPRGPIVDQIHPGGRWSVGAGAVFTWIPNEGANS